MKSKPEKLIRRRVVEERQQLAIVVDSLVEGEYHCPGCGRAARMLSPLLAARLFNLGTREIYRRIEAGSIHFVELPDRSLFVCGNCF
ncbi:MAG: hypothetical protein JSS81_11805 [Acidobacteria bacterium]|nr:hypothetical protein [Acidobacteriota bacterium]